METCLEGVKERVGRKREDMPWIADCLDDYLIESVKNYSNNERIKVYDLIVKYKTGKNIIIFHSREEANHYLDRL